MDVKAAQECLQNLGGVLGLTLAPETEDTPDNLAARPFIEMLLATRQKLREAKQYALADQIRDDLDRQGVTLEDTPQGSHWHYRNPG